MNQTTQKSLANQSDEPNGIHFPIGKDGVASTTQSGARIISAALEPLDAAAARSTGWETRWRRNYPKHFRRLVEAAIAQPQTVVPSAQTGLHRAWDEMQFTRDGKTESLNSIWRRLGFDDSESLATLSPDTELLTKTIRGTGPSAPAPWAVPYRGRLLRGDELRTQIDLWEANGIIEASAARALHACAVNPQWFDLSDRTMVLLGAGSEAGPLRWLAKWRANIAAIDIPKTSVWTRIESIIGAGNATLHVPIRAQHRQTFAAESLPGQGNYWTDLAGVDLLVDLPEIAQWVRQIKGVVDIAAHAYVDGEKHVRVALAMDFVQRAACAGRLDVGLAFMATPTDIFVVPEEAALAATEAYAKRSLIVRGTQSPLRLASGDRFFQPNIECLVTAPPPFKAGPSAQPKRYGIVDSLVLEQGPNYALAKRIQQWRALTARSEGYRVSLNVAPSTSTTSVVKNQALASGFAGADTFGIEVFEPETTNALIAALWVRDLRDPGSAANPRTHLDHPLELFMDNAAHGGLWRSAYLPRSALPFAAALGWVRQKFSA